MSGRWGVAGDIGTARLLSEEEDGLELELELELELDAVDPARVKVRWPRWLKDTVTIPL